MRSVLRVKMFRVDKEMVWNTPFPLSAFSFVFISASLDRKSRRGKTIMEGEIEVIHPNFCSSIYYSPVSVIISAFPNASIFIFYDLIFHRRRAHCHPCLPEPLDSHLIISTLLNSDLPAV